MPNISANKKQEVFQNMKVNYTLIGNRIAEKRKEQGLSQMRLADMTELSTSYISHIETAKKKPSLETLVKIANALNITTDEILCGNLIYDSAAYQTDLDILISDCTLEERHFLYETLKASKNLLREMNCFFNVKNDID